MGKVDDEMRQLAEEVTVADEAPAQLERQAMPEEGVAVRVDAIGRRYKLDDFGNHLDKGSGRAGTLDKAT